MLERPTPLITYSAMRMRCSGPCLEMGDSCGLTAVGRVQRRNTSRQGLGLPGLSVTGAGLNTKQTGVAPASITGASKPMHNKPIIGRKLERSRLILRALRSPGDHCLTKSTQAGPKFILRQRGGQFGYTVSLRTVYRLERAGVEVLD